MASGRALWDGPEAAIDLPFGLEAPGQAIEIRVYLEEPGRLRIGPIRLERASGGGSR